jgi:hypothetical protein
MSVSNLSTGMRPGVCLSSSRPTNPYEGQMIYETDTDLVYLWGGSAWVEVVSALTKAPRGVMAYQKATTDKAIGAESVSITAPSFNAVTGRLYRITYFEPDFTQGGSSNTTTLRVRLTNATGTIYNGVKLFNANSTNAGFGTVVTYQTFTTGSIVLVGTVEGPFGTARRTTDFPAVILVEDIGAA